MIQNNITTIDGSQYEGGGQMLRSALALSVILQKEFQIINIRSNRPNPGINNQLLSQIQLISSFVKSELQGVELGSKQMKFKPLDKFVPQDLFCKATTAQSITLILQSLLPISLNSQKPIQLSIQGGTYLNHSPTVFAWTNIFLKLIQEMGIQMKLEVIKEGYYPQGGGEVKALIQPINQKLKNYVNIQYSKINQLTCTYLIPSVSAIMQFDNQIVNNLKEHSENNVLPIKSNVKVVNSKKFKKCYGVSLLCHSSKNSYDFTVINDQDKSIEETVHQVINQAKQYLQNQTSFDEHHQDQLILLMALAEGKSEILIGKPSLHTYSLIYVIGLFLPECKIELRETDSKEQYLLSVQGIGYVF
ncbi:unnamed protein product (macronuclear) [Paramecium tetraurelia]|uniref:Integrase catalytic domain-containing protein n=1 Tax=Paramecium tetraurelia TaxID=5888 RepID=A0EEW6_PARTE|nr:uncharacterized protein GSPATT00026180001 [Paramecium tetraurelia]CAK93857.1 unnamed protein product [Paramecium tetraurelia]|eukprot:XP_001461230.1 hypothetical protein (macronuclear) [Paramecium tetraurelia strain d4-2]